GRTSATAPGRTPTSTGRRPAPRTGASAIAGKPDAAGELPEGRHRVGVRPRDDEHGAEAVVARERGNEELQADRECERLVRVLAAERCELVLARPAREHVAVG